MDVNKCIFSGRLCEDPEVKDIGDGKKFKTRYENISRIYLQLWFIFQRLRFQSIYYGIQCFAHHGSGLEKSIK